MGKIIEELRDGNKMLRFQVEQLWKVAIDQASTIERKDTLLEDKRVAITDLSSIIGKLRTENEKLKDRLGPPMTGTVKCDVETQRLIDALSPKPLPEEVMETHLRAIVLLRRVSMGSWTIYQPLMAEIHQFLEENE